MIKVILACFLPENHINCLIGCCLIITYGLAYTCAYGSKISQITLDIMLQVNSRLNLIPNCTQFSYGQISIETATYYLPVPSKFETKSDPAI